MVDLGYNYRIDEFRSAIDREQLKPIPAGNTRRRKWVNLYREMLGGRAPGMLIPISADREKSSMGIYVFDPEVLH